MRTALLFSSLCTLAACRPLLPVSESGTREHEAQVWHGRTDSLTVYIRDSVFIHEKGDTVRIERWRERYRERIRLQHDSVYIRDSVFRQVPVAVSRPPGAWQRLLMRIGKVSLLLMAAGMAFFLLRLFLRRP